MRLNRGLIEQTIKQMLDGADIDGVTLGKVGAHFGEQQRVAGLSYANLITQMRIATALERIASVMEKNTGTGSDEAQG